MSISSNETLSSTAVAWGRYSDMKPREIECVLAASPIAYVPWGALEWHSAHAPIGLDSTKAEGICVALAQRTGGVVLPAIPLAANTIKPYKGFPHSIDISQGLITSLAEEVCSQLADEGFRLVILFTGHYPPEQIDALQAGTTRAQAKCEGTVFQVCADNHFLEGGDFTADHAGAYETSYQMHFQKGSVDVSRLPDRELSLDEDGITGVDPRKASEAQGAKQLEVLLKNALPQIRAWAKQG
ncbi:creatininase family protein [Pelagicoccus enzymogenes]|uniref:creatininase family protein n=1 Tax=Pelagicoccus enzymogenes TaxID=2773457 RepID=UPI00280CBAB5|nr:creatininase family protein [Pelagicoccus enzymogenes]MDQ8200843.1 creatininase family protein [Pelagicoccus enzymogenes]